MVPRFRFWLSLVMCVSFINGPLPSSADQKSASLTPSLSAEFPVPIIPVIGGAPRLAFASDREERFQIWTTGAAASSAIGTVKVTTAGSGSQESRGPDWSQTANRIAYHFGVSGVRGIHTIKPDGRGDLRLTFDLGDERDPSWSSDGQNIVYAALPSGSQYSLRIHKVGNPATTDDDTDYALDVPVTGTKLRPAWSPDGTKIAFVTSGGPQGSDAEIAVIGVASSGGAVVAAGSVTFLTANTYVDYDPTWSPDSQYVAYSTTRNGNRDIYRLRVCVSASGCETGPDFKQLTSSTASDSNPSWSPDGASIVFVSERDGNRNLYIMSAGLGEQDSLTQVTSNPATDDDPAWMASSPMRVEVTQAVQCLDNPACFGDPSLNTTTREFYDQYCGADNPRCVNAVPLIAHKKTLVRVYVECQQDCDALPTGAKLEVYDAAGQLKGTAPRTGNYVYVADPQKQRSDLRHTLNFEPPTAWLDGQVTFRVTVAGVTEDEVVTFRPGNPLRIAYVAMPYAPSAGGPTYMPAPAVTQGGHSQLVKLYPVAASDVAYLRQGGFSEVTQVRFSQADAQEQYIAPLNKFWKRMTSEGQWLVRPDRLYGWVAEEAADDLCGISDPLWPPYSYSGRVAAGLGSCGAMTFAHEIGHNLNSAGLHHSPTAPGWEESQYPYPNPAGTIGEWGVDFRSGSIALLNPQATYDFMSYTNPRWISPYNYAKLRQGFQPVATTAATDGVAVDQRLLLASGTVYSPAITATLDPLFDITSTTTPDASSGTDYCLELRDATESVLDSRCFDLSFTNPETGEPTGANGFTFVLPYPNSTQAVVLTHLGAEVTRVTASAHAAHGAGLGPERRRDLGCHRRPDHYVDRK